MLKRLYLRQTKKKNQDQQNTLLAWLQQYILPKQYFEMQSYKGIGLTGQLINGYYYKKTAKTKASLF